MKNMANIKHEAELLGLKWKEIMEKSFRQDISHKGFLIWGFENFRECENFAKQFDLEIIEASWANGSHYISDFEMTNQALSFKNDYDDESHETTYFYKEMQHKAVGCFFDDTEAE
jgi:hypothetical protein